MCTIDVEGVKIIYYTKVKKYTQHKYNPMIQMKNPNVAGIRFLMVSIHFWYGFMVLGHQIHEPLLYKQEPWLP